MSMQRLLSAFQVEWIETHIERCLNLRARYRYCSDCVSSCPQNAIELTDDDVVIRAGHCNNCALCLSACSTGVFTHDHFNFMDLVLWSQEKTEIVLSCAAVPAIANDARQGRIPCLGLLDAPMLATLHAVGVEHIGLRGLDHCPQCPTQVGQQHLNGAPQGMADLPPGHPVLEVIATGPEDEAVPHGHTDESSVQEATPFSSEPTTDRRSFFSLLGKRMGGGMVKMLPMGLQKGPLQTTPKVIRFDGRDEAVLQLKSVPERHQMRLIGLFGGALGAENGTSWTARVECSNQCTGCSQCALRCPTGALAWQQDDHHTTLDYRGALCIGCGLCVALCPTKALVLTLWSDPTHLRHDPKDRFFAADTKTCAQCGIHYLPSSPNPDALCGICQNERDLDDEWMSFLSTKDHNTRAVGHG